MEKQIMKTSSVLPEVLKEEFIRGRRSLVARAPMAKLRPPVSPPG
jgi:hypothetical protein